MGHITCRNQVALHLCEPNAILVFSRSKEVTCSTFLYVIATIW